MRRPFAVGRLTSKSAEIFLLDPEDRETPTHVRWSLRTVAHDRSVRPPLRTGPEAPNDPTVH